MNKPRKYTIEDFLGALLLIAGLSFLGLFNFKSDEPLVEAGLRAQANAIAAETVHGMQVTLDGRHLTLSGLADTPEEQARVLAALKGLKGRGRVRSDATVLAPAVPFVFRAQHSGTGAMQFDGAIPTETLRARLAEDYGAGVAALTLASGMPDAQWPQVMQEAMRALQQLESGQLVIQDRAVQLRGTALSPVEADRAHLLMAETPQGYAVTPKLTVLDDGTPLRLSASRSAGARTGLSGKLNAALAAELSSETGAGAIQVSPLAVPFDGWEDSLRQGLRALDHLHTGHLSITGATLTLTGAAWSQASHEAAMTELAGLPDEMSVSHQITLADSGAPFGLRPSLSPSGVVASGKVPHSLSPRVLAALADAPVEPSALEMARISPGHLWWDRASLGAEALRYFETAEMTFEGSALSLTGTVQNPPQLAALQAHLAQLPEPTPLSLNVTLIDDGTPLRLELVKQGAGAVVSGKLPDAFLTDDLAVALNAPVTMGEVVRTPVPGPADWAETARVAAKALAQAESGTLTLSGTDITLTAVLLNPAREQEVLTALQRLPQTYTLTTAFTFQDDGRPFEFTLSFDGQHGVLNGKVPLDLGPSSQAAILGFPITAGTVEFAGIPADAEWWIAARSALKALAELDAGRLTLDAHQIHLTGTATDDTGAEAVQTRLAPYADRFKLRVEIGVE